MLETARVSAARVSTGTIRLIRAQRCCAAKRNIAEMRLSGWRCVYLRTERFERLSAHMLPLPGSRRSYLIVF